MEWIGEARQGSAAAFGRLIERHQRPLYGFLVSRVGRTDVADELTQQVFLKAWKALAGYRGEAAFQTWLFQIAINAARSWGRAETVRRWREKALALFDRADGPPSPESPPDPRADADPGRGAESRELGRRIRAAADSLPEREKTVFLLRHEQGLPLADIAAAMDVAEGTVKAHLHHALQKMRKCLEDAHGV